MEAAIFEVLTKASLFLGGLAAFVCWVRAGYPSVTITIKKG